MLTITNLFGWKKTIYLKKSFYGGQERRIVVRNVRFAADLERDYIVRGDVRLDTSDPNFSTFGQGYVTVRINVYHIVYARYILGVVSYIRD